MIEPAMTRDPATSARQLALDGCSPTPLAHYLKALAVLRLLGEQIDPAIRASWQGESLVLSGSPGFDEIVDFFLRQYSPSPVVAPWNGGSGFYPKDNKTAIGALSVGQAPRLARYRATIVATLEVLRELGIDEKVDASGKETLLRACRSALPEPAIDWLDAAFVLTQDGPKYPPLLGTGGNDGRLDFSNNFMQRLLDVIDPETGEPTPQSEGWLRSSLAGEATDGLQKGGAIGQFFPSAAGGNNQSAGFSGPTILNPWDFVLMIEGALLFAGASARRLESAAPGILSYPFTVRQSGVGYGSATQRDETDSRAEMWLPLWSRPATLAELKMLMSEGRAQVAGRTARNGVDFARAIATLGVDRGIDGFQRVGFQVRNGLAYFATPLGRHHVRRRRTVDLLDAIDPWLDRFLAKAKNDTAPSSAQRAARNLEDSILALTQRGSSELQSVLIALGACEAAMASSFRWAADPRATIRPVPPLGEAWLRNADDESIEYRLAAALASVSGRYIVGGRSRDLALRAHLSPVFTWERDGLRRVRWDENPGRDLVWGKTTLTDNLSAVLSRRLLLASQSSKSRYDDGAVVRASLSDIAAFVEGRTNDARIEQLLRGLLLVDWPGVSKEPLPGTPPDLAPDAAYGVLKLCFAGARVRDVDVPMVAAIVRNGAAGHARAASMALRRLHASGLAPAVNSLYVKGRKLRRVAAALLFPIHRNDVERLCGAVLRPERH